MTKPSGYFQRERCASTYARNRALIRVWYPRPPVRNHSRMSASIRNVTCSLCVTGLSPRRTTARANISGVISGLSERSISWSSRASASSQSVCDGLEVDCLLITCRFSCRNKTYRSIFFGMHYRDNSIFNETKRDEAAFPVIESGVLSRNGVAPKHRFAVGKVDAALAEIGAPLSLIPYESYVHCNAILQLRILCALKGKVYHYITYENCTCN